MVKAGSMIGQKEVLAAESMDGRLGAGPPLVSRVRSGSSSARKLREHGSLTVECCWCTARGVGL